MPGQATSPGSSRASPASRPDKIKVTLSFMKAYKAMRGPRDVEPSPLFACLAPRAGHCEDDDPFRLAGRDEVKMLNDVNDRLLGDDSDTRPLVADDDDSGARQTVFYFERPHTSMVLYSEDSGGHRTRPAAMADHGLDHEKLDPGWTEVNGAYSDGSESYVSDDDGDPASSRISAAEFRALIVGCKRNDVDDLRIPIVSTRSVRPLTPQDKIVDYAHEAGRVDARVFGGRRQFDGDDGDELSPAYRVDPGAARSVLWSPAGVTPERAGLFLSLPDGGLLYRRMAPQPCQELRERLFGDEGGCSSSSSSSSSSGSDDARRSVLTTFGWSEVNAAVAAHARPLVGAVVSGADVRDALRDGWRALRTCEAEEARLEAANAQAEAAVTALARRLARVEQREQQLKQQREQQRMAVARETAAAARRQRRIVRDVALQLRDLQVAVRAAEARLQRGREWQAVLARRLRTGEMRIQGVSKRVSEMGGSVGGGDEDGGEEGGDGDEGDDGGEGDDEGDDEEEGDDM